MKFVKKVKILSEKGRSSSRYDRDLIPSPHGSAGAINAAQVSGEGRRQVRRGVRAPEAAGAARAGRGRRLSWL